MTKHEINTTLGKFTFGWCGDWIYGRFENPDKARHIYSCNPFSGKYNFHVDPLNSLMDFIEDLKVSNRLT